jgi:hypothetical protein
VAPATTEAELGDTVTVVTTGGAAVTVMLDVPVFPELVAVIVAGPAATPVTTPLELTVAVAALLVVQMTVCPDITLPCWSLTVAVRGVVAPTATEAELGETVTVVTTGGLEVTVMLEVPDFPELVAMIVTGPAATPVTTPFASTVAVAALLVDHVTVCPLIGLPCSSLTVA